MKTRIRIVRESERLTQAEFGERLNLSRSFVCALENGQREPGPRTILDICREFQISENWLRTGDGEMYRPMSTEEKLATMFGGILAGAESEKQRLIKAIAMLPDEMVSAVVDAIIAMADAMRGE